MAVDCKKGFVVYHDYLDAIEVLSDEEVGKLFRAMLKYSIDGTRPDLPKSINVAFSFISG